MIPAPESTPLARAFFNRPVLEVAPDLLGRTLVRSTGNGSIVLRLTEVEAYAGPDDPGSHAYRGRSDRNAVMFGPPGYAYVYFTYGTVTVPKQTQPLASDLRFSVEQARRGTAGSPLRSLRHRREVRPEGRAVRGSM